MSQVKNAKTIYIRDGELEIWDSSVRYANLIGTTISRVIVEKLREYVINMPACWNCKLAPLLPEWKYCPKCRKRL